MLHGDGTRRVVGRRLPRRGWPGAIRGSRTAGSPSGSSLRRAWAWYRRRVLSAWLVALPILSGCAGRDDSAAPALSFAGDTVAVIGAVDRADHEVFGRLVAAAAHERHGLFESQVLQGNVHCAEDEGLVVVAASSHPSCVAIHTCDGPGRANPTPAGLQPAR